MWLSSVLTPTFWWVFVAQLGLAGLFLGLFQYLATSPKSAVIAAVVHQFFPLFWQPCVLQQLVAGTHAHDR